MKPCVASLWKASVSPRKNLETRYNSGCKLQGMTRSPTTCEMGGVLNCAVAVAMAFWSGQSRQTIRRSGSTQINESGDGSRLSSSHRTRSNVSQLFLTHRRDTKGKPAVCCNVRCTVKVQAQCGWGNNSVTVTSDPGVVKAKTNTELTHQVAADRLL